MKNLYLSRLSRYMVALTLLTIAMLLIAPLSASAATAGNGSARNALRKGPLPQHGPPSKPQQRPKNVRGAAKTTAKPINPDPIDVKMLVISADGNEADLPGIKQTLDYLGMPYDVYIVSQTPGGLTPDKLTDPNNSVHAFYEGVILTTGYLGYNSSAGWVPYGLTTDEATTLANFEVTFGIRQITWYTYPDPQYGLNWPSDPSGTDTTNNPITVPFTAAGNSIFGSYANTATPLKIQSAFSYHATPLDADTQVLLQDGSNNALGAIKSYRDSTTNAVVRQNLALTFDSNQFLTHNLILSYGLINWVTKGVFLGERHAYLLAQPDDVLIDDDIWPVGRACTYDSYGRLITDGTGVTARMSGNDLTTFIKWQKAKQAQATTSQTKIEWPFVGIGTTKAWITDNGTPAGQYKPDTLTPAASTNANQNQFNWLSHTYDHDDLDHTEETGQPITYTAAMAELQQNDQVATKTLGLKNNYTKQAMVTPDVSGLDNQNFLQAAYDFGIRYVVSDTSITTPTDPLTGLPRHVGTNPSPNTGRYNSLVSGILEIPRHPVNLYYNVTTPQQWLAEDNCLYPTGANGHVDTPAQLLDRESTVLLGYLLTGDIDPLMFHQPNLIAYDGTHSLLSDLLDATFTKYNALFKLPIQTLNEVGVGQKMANRMGYNASGVTAKIVPATATAAGSITLTATNAATVPLTGVNGTCGAACTVETYGGQPITSVKLNAGQSITVTTTWSSQP